VILLQILRHDTVVKDQLAYIDVNNQQCIFTLGRRGTGKSFNDEAITTAFYQRGFTVLDLWSSDNFENAFWVIDKEDTKKKRFPITILAPETLDIDQDQLNRFNEFSYTEEDFYKKYPDKIYNCVNPQLKPVYERGKEWIKIVKLPAPTAKLDSEQNKMIEKIIENTILECRQNRRIMVFNPKTYANETHMYRTLEIIFRSLGDIADKHFLKLKHQDLGKTSRDQMTPQEKSWHKMVVLIREMGELAPAKLKGDRTGESLKTKKALLQLIRKVRHYRIWVVADWQKASDVEDSIRQQADIWIIKKYTRRLGGDEWKWVFEYIKFKRQLVFDKRGFNQMSRSIADSGYPNLDEITDRYMYVIFGNDKISLRKVRELKHHHKEPTDNFEKITGIEFKHDYSKLQNEIIQDSKSTSKTDEKALHNAIYVMKTGNKMKWNEILQKLTIMQQSGEISWPKPFSEMKEGTIQKWFSRYLQRENHA